MDPSKFFNLRERLIPNRLGGTREFFRMKHRIFRYLVEEMDFKTFAIEASWPEANRINHYLQTGEGDPARLLAGLYFWTWNTQTEITLD